VSVTAPPRPPRSSDPVDREELEALVEALIEEARQRARRRRRIYAASVALVALVGIAVFLAYERTAQSQTASPAPAAPSGAAGTPSSKIAFLRLVNGARGESSYELYVMNADGSGKRRLARSPLAGNDLFRAVPAWSPDGRKLAFAIQLRRSAGLCDRAGACNDEIFVMNADGSGLRRLTRNAVPDGHAAWSPDGRKIAFLSWRDGTGADVFVMNADGSDQRNLTRKPGNEGGPAWSPDGRAILFTAVPPGQPLWVGGSRSASGPYRDVYVMNADGSDQRNLTHTREAEEYAAAWAPDGRTIAFAAYDGRANRIFVINADGSGRRALTHKITETFMTWSPDGQKIAFFDASVSVVNADGSGLRRLARNVAFHGPSWSPNGQKLIFVRLRHPWKPRPATGTPPPPSPSPAADLWVMNEDGSGQRNLTRTPTTSDGWAATWARSKSN
jgi:Tol biopolymer transport system component